MIQQTLLTLQRNQSYGQVTGPTLIMVLGGKNVLNPQGSGSYADFSGTLHKGQFFQDMSFDDLWKTDGTSTTSVTVRHTETTEDALTTDSDVFTFTRDNVAPTITSGETADAIDENSGANQIIYTASATGQISGFYLAGDDMSHFTIDGSSGQVTLTADHDYETKNSYEFTVTASDAAGNTSAEQTVTLAINNLLESSVSTSTTSPTSQEAIPITIDFDADVQGFSLTGFQARFFASDGKPSASTPAWTEDEPNKIIIETEFVFGTSKDVLRFEDNIRSSAVGAELAIGEADLWPNIEAYGGYF